MKWFFSSLCLSFLILTGAVGAQPTPDPSFSGGVLINILELGVRQDPNHLFYADLNASKITELLVEDAPVFAPWYGWSVDGNYFAYLAPARRGEFFEVWVATSNIDAPNPTPVFFDIGRNAVAAAWNPRFNTLAAATNSPREADGVFLYYANTDWIDSLIEADFAANPIFDWSYDGNSLVYSTADNALYLYDFETEIQTSLREASELRLSVLPNLSSGWSGDSNVLVFNTPLEQALWGISLQDNNRQLSFNAPFNESASSLRLLNNELVMLDDKTVLRYDLNSETIDQLPLDVPNELEPPLTLAGADTLLINSFIQIGDDRFAECLVINLTSRNVRFVREALGAGWAHTICRPLVGGSHFALMTSDTLTPYDQLSPEETFQLHLVPLSLERSTLLSETFAGFTESPMRFSARRGQLIMRQGDELVIYNTAGEMKTLVSLTDLDLESDLLDIRFEWQP